MLFLVLKFVVYAWPRKLPTFCASHCPDTVCDLLIFWGSWNEKIYPREIVFWFWGWQQCCYLWTGCFAETETRKSTDPGRQEHPQGVEAIEVISILVV
jgi:hypothetical protein